MNRTPVKSSNVKSIGYDMAAQELEVEFNSGVYVYSDVPPQVYSELMAAESAGKYVAANIKGLYESRRVEQSSKL